MNYAQSLSGINGLGSLPVELKNIIKNSPKNIKSALKKADRLKGLGFVPEKVAKEQKTQSFDEVVDKYNQGITEAEIQAWVWYRRRLGIPMHGWEKYYLKTGNVKADLLTAKKETALLDAVWRVVRTVPVGAVLGTANKRTHEYAGDVYQLVRTPDNELVFIKKQDISFGKSDVSASEAELKRLVKAGALYYFDGELLPEPIYTFGNIYEKLERLEKDQEAIVKSYGQKVYDNHKQKLESRKPAPISFGHENPAERPYLTPYSEFSKEFCIDMLKPSTGIVFGGIRTLTEAFKEWLDTLPREMFGESAGHNVWEFYVKGRFPSHKFVQTFVDERMGEMKAGGSKAHFSDADIASMVKEVRADIVSAAKNEGQKLFSQFLNEALTEEHQDKLDRAWNKQFNGDAEINYSRVPMGCELSATWNGFPWEMKPVQREGVGFMEAVQSGIVAFDVGVGKTLTAIVEMAQALHDGKCKKALLCVPNGVYEKWKAEMFGQFDKKGNLISTGILSGTGIKLNEWGNLGAKWINKVDVKNVPDKSITLVNYSGLVNIGFSYDEANGFIEELKGIITQNEDKSWREVAKEEQKIAETIGKALEKNEAQMDVAGFDYLVIDEAHNFKNIFTQVKKKETDGKKRFTTTSGSTTERGIKAFFIANYIQRKYGKNVMLLSATPFTNQPIEVYSMLSLVGYESMKRRNIANLNDFFELHVREEQENVVTMREKIEQRPVVKAFNNRMLLQSLIYNHIIYRTADGEKRPKKVNLPKVNEYKDGRMMRLNASEQILTYLKMTPKQRLVQNGILNEINSAIAKRKFGKILGSLGKSLNNALSPFIAMGEYPQDYKEFVEESPKIKYALECIRTVKNWHENEGETCSGQIIYINRGKEYFKYIQEWLETELGFKRGINYKEFMKKQGAKESDILDIRGTFDEVMIIEGGNSTPEKKDAIKEAFNAGLVKVIIGTSTISEGMDFQKRGTVIYNLYPEYNPTQLRQLEGRIWRFGNPYENVRIVLPLVQDSMDVFIFQKLEEKTARLNDIWYRSDRGNVLDLDALDPEEVKFALITKIEEIADIVVKRERKELERKIGISAGNIPILKENKWNKKRYDDKREKLISSLSGWTRFMEYSNHIKFPPTDDELKELDKAERDAIKKDLELHRKMKEFDAKGNANSDSEIAFHIVRIKNKFARYDTTEYEYYKEVKAEVSKAEKLFTSKGFSEDDNIDEIIAKFQAETDKLREQLKNVNSKEYFKLVMADVRQKKSALAIEGKTVMQRVEEFAKLNYLLAYRGGPIPISKTKPVTKALPSHNAADEDEELFLLELEAEAEIEILELLEL